LARRVHFWQVALFLALLSPYLALEVAYRLDPAVLNRLPHPKFYANLTGSLRPDVRAVAFWHPSLPFRYATDGQGLRLSTPAAAKAEHRIVCLGDSYTFGFGVPDGQTFPSQLQRVLDSRPGPDRFQVVNTGAMDTGIVEHLYYFQTKGSRLPADLMVLQFNIYDLELLRSDSDARAYKNGKIYDPLEDSLLAEDINIALIQSCRTNPVYAFLTSQPKLQPETPAKTVPDAEQDRLRLAKRLAGDKDKLLDERYLGFLEPLWRRYLDNVQRLRQAAADAGLDFLLVIVPDPAQLHDFKNGPSAAILEYCRSRGIKTLDMTTTFRRLFLDQGINPFLEPLDHHCSAVGNAAIARGIADRIGRDGAGRPVFLAGNEPMRYGEPITLSLGVDAAGRIVFPDNGVVEIVAQESERLVLARAAGGGVKYLTTAPGGGEGRAGLRLRLKRPMDAAALVFFPHAAAGEPGGRCDVALRSPGQCAMFSTAASPVPTGWDTFDQEAFLELALGDPQAGELDLDVTTRGDAGLGLQDLHIGFPRRRLELILYPRQRF
jgi:hypothetical protein